MIQVYNTLIGLLMIYEINNIWTAEMKWKSENEEMIVAVNATSVAS